MKKKGYFQVRDDKPANYYRTGVTQDDFRRVMQDAGWLSLTQIAGLLADKVPPETKCRYAYLGRSGWEHLPLEQRLSLGLRRMVQLRIWRYLVAGRVEKHGSDEDAKYRWIAGEDNLPRQDTAGRRHTVASGA